MRTRVVDYTLNVSVEITGSFPQGPYFNATVTFKKN